MDLIISLQETRDETLRYFDLPKSELSISYGIGKWTIKQLLVHLADAESVLHERIKRVIAEPKTVIWAFDQDLWCTNLEYETFPIKISKALFDANRQSILFLADKYYLKFGAKEFVHSETGLRTLKDEFDKVLSHNQSHLKQIKTALLNK